MLVGEGRNKVDQIWDPAMGTAGFLVAAEEFMRKNHGDMLLNDEQAAHFNTTMFHGFDTAPTMLRIGTMNMMLHGVKNPSIGLPAYITL